MRNGLSLLGVLAVVGMMGVGCAHTTDRTSAQSTPAGDSESLAPAGDPWIDTNRLVADPTSGFWPATGALGSGAASMGGPQGARSGGQVLR